MEIALRDYHPTDKDRLLEIAIAAWEPIYRQYRQIMGEGIFNTVFPDWRSEKRRQVGGACDGDHGARVIVADCGGCAVGFVTFYRDRDRRIGEISNNAVDPAWQGRGIATRMYRSVIDRLQVEGVRVVKVTTGGDPSHALARRAYEKAGFVHSLPGVDYYLEIEDDVWSNGP